MSTVIKSLYDGNTKQIKDYISNFEKDPAGFLQAIMEQDFCQNSAIHLLTILNDQSIIENAVANSYNLNQKGTNGCGLVHFAAMWNRGELLKYLYFAGCDMYSKTFNSETPHDLAIKYDQAEAKHVLEWIGKSKLKKGFLECRDDFIALIQMTKDLLAKADKMEYSKEERKIADSACMDGETWINKNKEATLSMLRTKKEQIEMIVEPFFRKKSPSNSSVSIYSNRLPLPANN